MARYRHYKNLAEPGQTVFFTTALLNFVPLFENVRIALRMQDLIAEIHQHYNAPLFAYVIMPEHIHFITRLPNNLNASEFMKRFKSYSAKKIIPLLDETETSRFNAQRGLNQRFFWQRSFRSVPIDSEKIFWQKLRYIHENPVRRGLVSEAHLYPYSSARRYEEGSVDADFGLFPVET
ncbi:MAG TPA: transposase [Fimbriimonadales bacterium]|nr:transposase [Fimbriimonadales bacterium]